MCFLTSLLWSVKQSLHSYDPKWFFIKYGSLLMSMVSRASCRNRSRLSRLLSEADATPPLPVLPPARCWKSIFAGRWTQTRSWVSIKTGPVLPETHKTHITVNYVRSCMPGVKFHWLLIPNLSVILHLPRYELTLTCFRYCFRDWYRK